MDFSVILFGGIVVCVGTGLLLFGSMRAMLAFTMITTLFGGSAALELSSHGSSIPPANLALVFLLVRVALPSPGWVKSLREAFTDNIFLIIFSLYGAISAWVLPRLFANATKITPLRPDAKALFEATPVAFSMQNVTTSIYLLGTLIAGFGAYIGASKPGSAALIVRISVTIAITHAVLGFMSVAFDGTALDGFIDFFRNGHYAQLDQTIDGMSRMNGIWPEASGFAAYGGAWLIFMVELWIRDVRPRWTGPAALILGLALLLSTSSTAFVCLGGYAVVACLRTVFLPWTLPLRKALIVAGVVTASVAITLFAISFLPQVAHSFADIIQTMTVKKTQSYSGQQRAYWAKQGFDAFLASRGFGIGAGSFRSSSLLTAILGSMGVIGVISFAGHLMSAFKPLRASTYFGVEGNAAAVGSAASWAGLLMLMPAAIAAPSPDPGLVWPMFCGFALALRKNHAQTSTYGPRATAALSPFQSGLPA